MDRLLGVVVAGVHNSDSSRSDLNFVMLKPSIIISFWCHMVTVHD